MTLPYNADNCFGINDPRRPWRVVHTKGRHEKKLAEECVEDHHVPCFLPLREHETRKNGRIRKTTLPMFSGYLFVKCTWDEKGDLFRTGHVVSFLDVKDQEELEEDLVRVRKVIEISVPVAPHPFAKVGEWVRIKKGPFKGLDGLIVKKRTGYRFVVNVRMIKRAVALDIDAEMMEPA